MKKCDVFIVGAGAAGASLGCLLATRTGLDVIIVEASDRLGGRARAVPFADGLIDSGLHALLLGKRSSLFAMGRPVTQGLSVKPLGASIFQRGRLRQLFGRRPFSIFRAEAFDLPSLIATTARALRKNPRKALYRISLDEFCERFRASNDARDSLRCFSVGLLASADFHRVSIGEILAYLALAARRIGMLGYPIGGWNSIWERFKNILEAKSGRLRLKECLQELRIKNGRVAACITDKETYLPVRVVLAVPPKSIEEQGLIPAGSLDQDTLARLGRCRMTYGLNVDILIEGKDMPDNVIFTLDPPTLAFAPTTASPNLIGHGRHILTIFTPLGTNPDAEPNPESKAGSLIELYDQIIRGLKGRIIDRMVSVLPVTGADVSVEFNYLDLPPVKCPSVSNLYMVGDWVKVLGAGGERAFASALRCHQIRCNYKRPSVKATMKKISAQEITIKEIPTDDPLYLQERELRAKVLREPLGLAPGTEVFPFEYEAHHYVALDKNRVIGCVLFHQRGDEGKLFQTAVYPEYQSKGIGKRLVKFLEDEVRKMGVKKIFLHSRYVVKDFYKKLGYEEEGGMFIEVGVEHIRMVKSVK